MKTPKIIPLILVILICSCVPKRKFRKAESHNIEVQKELNKNIVEANKLISSLKDSILNYQDNLYSKELYYENKIAELIKSHNEIIISSPLSYILDSDEDGVIDYYDKCPYEAGDIRYYGCPLKIINSIKTDTKGNNNKLTDIPIGKSIQKYIAIPFCPDSIEVNTPGYIEVLLDFTGKKDSIDIDVLNIAINGSDTADTELIKKRIYIKDICSVAKFLKVIVLPDSETSLIVTPEPGSDEYTEVSSLLNNKKVYKWKLRASETGKFGYTIHVVWYNTHQGAPTTLRQDVIDKCPNYIKVYQKQIPFPIKVMNILQDNMWQGFSASIAFFLGFIGRVFWGKVGKLLNSISSS